MSCARAVVAALVAVSLCLASYGQNPPSTAKDLLPYIDRVGAETVVKQLTSGDGSQWHRVMSIIGLGSPAWLEIAIKLLPATDSGTSEDLYGSLAIALTQNPNAVLSLVGPNLSIEHVCTVPSRFRHLPSSTTFPSMNEPDEKTVREHKLKVHTALQMVTSQDLYSKKLECFKAINR